jgi:membrane carboxypeptidase/penicillin-binding protein
MVGGRDFRASSFNRATLAKRQPGSAFKPFIYAAAVEGGYGPDDVIEGPYEPVIASNAAWTPDDEHVEDESITLRDGLRLSSNRAAVRLLTDVGLKQTLKSARGFGFDDLPMVPSVALGSGEVTLSQITAAYGAFANAGAVFNPTLIRRVQDMDGLLLLEDHPKSQQAIRPVTAYLMADMLRGVIDGGTAYGVRQLGFTLPAAGKTGTTNDYKDAWFIGFTPSLVTGVWVGYDQPQTIRRHGYAAELAVPMWTRYMKVATKGQKPVWIDRPRCQWNRRSRRSAASGRRSSAGNDRACATPLRFDTVRAEQGPSPEGPFSFPRTYEPT